MKTMFLIVAKWRDNSDSIFLVGSDPANKKLPNWSEVFEKLDTIADPADATIQFARVSREFILLRDEETQEFTLDDPNADSQLRSLKLTNDASIQWYQTLLPSRDITADQSLDEDIDDTDDEIDEDEPPF
jgi:hypothetical protein